jgi:hypothetical protein
MKHSGQQLRVALLHYGAQISVPYMLVRKPTSHCSIQQAIFTLPIVQA